MSWRVLVTAPYMLPFPDEYRRRLEELDIELVLAKVEERVSEEELLAMVEDIDGMICGDDVLSETVLMKAGRLKVIAKWGTGIDSIDQAAAKRLGIRVCNTTNAFTDAVADTVLGYMLAFSRHLPWMDRDVRAGRWVKPRSKALKEHTLGVLGVGHIGKAVVRRALGFGMRVLGCDIQKMPEAFLQETGLQMTAKNDLLGRSDIVSLNCDLNPTSYHIMDTAAFRCMRPSAVLINTARGPLVEEKALVSALRDKRLAGAALDVFEIEPLPADSGLRNMDNVLLAPHNANASVEARERVHESTIRSLLEGLGIEEPGA